MLTRNLSSQPEDPLFMKTLGVLTSGGDAPGMNPALRAVARTAFENGCRVVGINNGYDGIFDGNVEELGGRVTGDSVRALGEFESVAANEPGFRVRAAVYAVDVEGAIAPKAEIEEMVWVDPRALPALDYAPLTRDHVLPLAL